MRHFSASIMLCAAALGGAGCSTDPVAPPEEIELALAPGLSGDGQSGEVGVALGLSLRVLVTRNGVPAEGVQVQWAAAAGSGTVGPAVGVSNADGIASGVWTMPTTSGPMTATASVADDASTAITFHATAEAGPATSLAQSGNTQSAAVGLAFGEPLTIRLADQYGNPVEGVDVGWAVISGTVTLSAASAPTDASGSSSIDVTAGATPGAVVVRATPQAALASSNFSLTVLP